MPNHSVNVRTLRHHKYIGTYKAITSVQLYSNLCFSLYFLLLIALPIPSVYFTRTSFHTHFVSGYKFIPSGKGKNLLMMNDGYTFKQCRHTTTYYCSKQSAGCKSRVKLDKAGNILDVNVAHTHPPPQYVVSSDGSYVKIS